jgi:hypothetical protein
MTATVSVMETLVMEVVVTLTEADLTILVVRNHILLALYSVLLCKESKNVLIILK